MARTTDKLDTSGEDLGTGRIETLSDGVFAIAMTLLVFDLKPAALPFGASEAVLQHALLAMLPEVLSVGLSFLILGIYWVAHQHQFRVIRRVDRTLLWINLALLVGIALIPVSARLLGEYGHYQTVIVLYGCNLIAVRLMLYVHWAYATGRYRLVDPWLSPESIAYLKRRILWGPVAYLGAIGLSFWDTRLSLLVYVLVHLQFILPSRREHIPAPRPVAGSSAL